MTAGGEAIADSLRGNSVVAVWVFRSEGVHPAWVDELTLPIVAFGAFLDVGDGALVRISPCEVDMGPDRYPALGLQWEACSREALRWLTPGGYAFPAEPLEEARMLLPFTVTRVEASDPLGEATLTQFALVSPDGGRILFRHIMPPMTLGIGVEAGGSNA